MQDNALLTQYTQNHSEAAFAQLLAKYLPLVYRTCYRELGAEALAEDAAQVVFLLLARKAKSLHASPSLAGWLYKTSVFVAKDIRKQEARRTRREEAAMQEAIHAQIAPSAEWETVEPLLNSALSALKPADREAVLLRFLEGHTLAETGALLGISEDAARMRCSRALDKMRRFLTARGAAITTVALAALLTTEAARPVSAQAVSVLTTRMLDALATGPSPNILLLSKGISHTMKIIKIKYAALATLLLLSGVVIPLTHAVPPKLADLPDTPQTVRSILDQAQAAADSDRTMKANFSYVVTDPTNGVRKNIGIVKLMKPNYAAISFSTDLGLPTTTEIHSDGQTLWNYHPPVNNYSLEPADPQGRNINVWRLITIGGFFSVDTWIRGGIYADPSELHYIGRQTIDGIEYQVLEHKMIGSMHHKAVPFDQKVFFGPDHLIHRFTLDFTIDGKPGTEYADLTNIQLSQPMQSSDFAYTPPVGAILVPKQD